jgi:hypothetical protein
MRKRWRWDSGPFMATWFLGGLLTVAAIAIFTEPHHAPPGHRLSTATAVALAVWLGPVLIGGAAAFLVGCVAPALWKARPHRTGE